MKNLCKVLASMLTLQQCQKAGEEHQVRFKLKYGLQGQWHTVGLVGTVAGVRVGIEGRPAHA